MTVLLTYQDIVKTYGGVPLFRNLSVNIRENERLGLIGSNGCGKSTLLKILAGRDTPEAGEFFLKKHARIAYLAQEDPLDPDATVGQVLLGVCAENPGGNPDTYRIARKIIGADGFKDETQNVSELSGGWKKRLAIVKELSSQPDLLFLDEPTNHMDINAILWLEDLLSKAPFAFIAVSHDRQFLENTCTDIMELGKVYPDEFLKVHGSYDRFVQIRKDVLDSQVKKEASLSNRMRRETEWLRQGAKARSTKAKYRIDSAGKLEQELRDVRHRNRHTGTVDLAFEGTQRKTKKLLVCRNLTKGIQGRDLFTDISLELTPGTRLGLVGGNGTGKTTFMKILEGIVPPDAGDIRRADGLRVAVFDQDRARLDPEMTLKEALSPAGESVIYQNRSVHVVSWAKRFLFTPDQLLLPISHLSGGEKARILIAELMRQPADILLLDEPTNDLDIPSLEVLEESLMEFPGAMVVATHDRRFLDQVTNRVLFLDGSGGAGLFADHSQCLKKQKPEPKKAKKPAAEEKITRKPLVFSYKDKYELEQMEAKILEAEAAVEDLTAQTSDPEVMKDPVRMGDACTRLQMAQETVEALYARWEELEALKNR